MNSKKLIILIVFTAVIVLFLGFADTAYANDTVLHKIRGMFSISNILGLNYIGMSAIGIVIGFINYFIGFIGSIAVTLGGILIGWTIDLNARVLTTEVVRIGWTITRDLANLGFVLVIIIIAFTTILRWEGYETKKLLSRLVVAALLVNFSLVFAGVFVDFSGMLTNYFVCAATDCENDILAPVTLGMKLAGALNTQSFLRVKDAPGLQGTLGMLAQDFGGLVAFLASMFFVAVLTIVSATVLIGLAILFLIRYLALAILLILMPLAWLFWILPSLQHLWSKWWSEFFHWIWFAPMATFFIFLSLTIAKTPTEIAATPSSELSQAFGRIDLFTITDIAGITINNFMEMLLNMLLVVGILVGGVIASSNVATALAKTSMSVARDGGKLFMKYGGTGLRDRFRTAGYQAPDAAGKGGGSLIQRGTAKFTGVRLIGGMAQKLNTWATSGTKEQVSGFEKELGGLNKTAFMNSLSDSFSMSNPAFAAAAAKVAADKGYVKDLKKDNPAALEQIVMAARQTGTEGAILSKDPTLAKIGAPNKEEGRRRVAAAMKKAKPQDITNLDEEALSDIDVASNFSAHQLEELIKKGSTEQTIALQKAYNEAIAVEDIAKKIGTQPIIWDKLASNIKKQYNNDIQQWNEAVNKAKADWDSFSEEFKTSYQKGIENMDLHFNNSVANQKNIERVTKRATRASREKTAQGQTETIQVMEKLINL